MDCVADDLGIYFMYLYLQHRRSCGVKNICSVIKSINILYLVHQTWLEDKHFHLIYM